MATNKLKIINEKYLDDDGNPVEAEIIASSFPRWEERGWTVKKDEDGEPETRASAENVGEGEPSAAQQEAHAKALAAAAESGASPEEAAKAAAEAAAKAADPTPAGEQQTGVKQQR